jgi:precorrin-6A/cobalt-precorrin-6A reductase
MWWWWTGVVRSLAGRRILLLGGTADARALASLLHRSGADFVSSLAGRTAAPLMPEGEVRVGGFGGVSGLADYVRSHGIGVIADCTHPFAAMISANAFAAAAETDARYVRLERPEWVAGPGDKWLTVPCVGAASDAILPGARVLLTTGVKDLPSFFSRPDIGGVARMIGEPSVDVPPAWRLVQERPPFSLASELALMRDEKISVLVTKNAGGIARHKLDAARELGVQVVMVSRSVKAGDEVVANAEDMFNFLTSCRT